MIIGTVRPEEARVFDAFEGYHTFTSEDQQDTYGSFLVEFYDAETIEDEFDDDPIELPAGWYWVAQFPGCMPDGEPSGPFASSRQAMKDADEWNLEFDLDFED